MGLRMRKDSKNYNSVYLHLQNISFLPWHIDKSMETPDTLQPKILDISRYFAVDSEVLRSKRTLITKGPPQLLDEPTVMQLCEWRMAITNFLKLVPGFQMEMLDIPPNLEGLLDEHFRNTSPYPIILTYQSRILTAPHYTPLDAYVASQPILSSIVSISTPEATEMAHLSTSSTIQCDNSGLDKSTVLFSNNPTQVLDSAFTLVPSDPVYSLKTLGSSVKLDSSSSPSLSLRSNLSTLVCASAFLALIHTSHKVE